MQSRSERKGIAPRILHLHSHSARNWRHLTAGLNHLRTEWKLLMLLPNGTVSDVYPIMIEDRDGCASFLRAHGVEVDTFGPSGLRLPCHEGLEPLDVEYILQEILLWLMTR